LIKKAILTLVVSAQMFSAAAFAQQTLEHRFTDFDIQLRERMDELFETPYSTVYHTLSAERMRVGNCYEIPEFIHVLGKKIPGRAACIQNRFSLASDRAKRIEMHRESREYAKMHTQKILDHYPNYVNMSVVISAHAIRNFILGVAAGRYLEKGLEKAESALVKAFEDASSSVREHESLSKERVFRENMTDGDISNGEIDIVGPSPTDNVAMPLWN
jgi:hypothetical protein